jgi:hypothetical protein
VPLCLVALIRPDSGFPAITDSLEKREWDHLCDGSCATATLFLLRLHRLRRPGIHSCSSATPSQPNADGRIIKVTASSREALKRRPAKQKSSPITPPTPIVTPPNSHPILTACHANSMDADLSLPLVIRAVVWAAPPKVSVGGARRILYDKLTREGKIWNRDVVYILFVGTGGGVSSISARVVNGEGWVARIYEDGIIWAKCRTQTCELICTTLMCACSLQYNAGFSGDLRGVKKESRQILPRRWTNLPHWLFIWSQYRHKVWRVYTERFPNALAAEHYSVTHFTSHSTTVPISVEYDSSRCEAITAPRRWCVQ